MVNTILTDDERPELPSPVYGPDTQVDEDSDGAYTVEQMEAYADAREAAVLAKLAQQEPVAWRVHPFDYGIGHQGAYAATHQPQQRDAWIRKGWAVQALYTHPAPQQADRQRVPDGWIETSKAMPPSGQVVLAYYKNKLGNTRRIRAQWVAAKTSEASIDSDCGEYDEATDTYYDPEGWYECIDNWDCYSSVFVSAQITHWMPLPAAPGAAPEATAQEKSNG